MHRVGDCPAVVKQKVILRWKCRISQGLGIFAIEMIGVFRFRYVLEAGKDQQGKGFDPRKLLAPGAEAIKATVREKIELFGSANKA